MAKAVATVGVSVVARTKKFKTGMTSARRDLKKFGKSIVRTAERTAKFGVMLASVAAGGLVALTKRSLATMDSTQKMASRLGLATNELIGLRHAAKLTGVATATLDMALQRMTRRIAEAAVGTGEAKAAIKELGLNAQRLAAAGPAQAFAEIAEAMQRVQSQSDRVRLAFKLFDSEGVALVNTLKLTRAELAAVAKKTQILGLTFSQDAAKGVQEANDAVADMLASFKGLGRTITTALLPHIESLARTVTGLAIQLRSLDARTIANIKSWVKWVAGVGVAVLIIPKIVRGISVMVKAFKVITSASITMQAFSGPAGWAAIAAGAAVATAGVIAASKAFDSMAASAKDAWGEATKLGESLGDIKVPKIGGGGMATAGGGGGAVAGAMAIRQGGNTLSQTAKRIFDQTRTPLENFSKALKTAQDALFKGLIGSDTFLRQLRRLNKVFGDVAFEKIRDNAVALAEARHRLRDLLSGKPSTTPAFAATSQQVDLSKVFLGFGGGPRGKPTDVIDKGVVKEIQMLRAEIKAREDGTFTSP